MKHSNQDHRPWKKRAGQVIAIVLAISMVVGIVGSVMMSLRW